RRTCAAPQRLPLEHLGEAPAQRGVDLVHPRLDAEACQRGDAVLADAAGDDAAVMAEIGIDIERDAVEAHPMADAHADGGDLTLAPTPRRSRCRRGPGVARPGCRIGPACG